MKRLPSLPVEFPNMLYIFILWIKKKKTERKGDFMLLKQGRQSSCLFTVEEEVHCKPV